MSFPDVIAFALATIAILVVAATTWRHGLADPQTPEYGRWLRALGIGTVLLALAAVIAWMG